MKGERADASRKVLVSFFENPEDQKPDIKLWRGCCALASPCRRELEHGWRKYWSLSSPANWHAIGHLNLPMSAATTSPACG